MTSHAGRSARHHNRHVMYGAEFSYYSGKLRAYLRKKGIPFTEIPPSVWTYKRFIIPRTGVQFIPVLHTPDDEVLQDTTAIIDALEPRFSDYGVYPQTPRQRLAALLLELYGDEWLLIPAMHYRWNFPDRNQPFIYDEFGAMAFPWFPRPVRRWLGRRIGDRFRGFVPLLGVRDSTRKAIEKSWRELLVDLNRHFRSHRFLFGDRASIGDLGLIGPMYAHLYRDPAPGALMRRLAPDVAAWVERMQSNEPARGEFLDDDAIPDTLLPVLQRMAREQVPVLLDTERRLADWAGDKPPGTQVPRALGEHEFRLGDARGRRAVLPHGLWRWQRPRDDLRSLACEPREQAMKLADRLGLRAALSAVPPVRVERDANRFVTGT